MTDQAAREARHPFEISHGVDRNDDAACDCRANDWVEGDNGAIRCVQCGGYAGEPGTSIRVAAVPDRNEDA